MAKIPVGTGPKFTVEHVNLPFTGVDVGQVFRSEGTLRLDAINPEGPTFVFEVLELDFPGMERGTIRDRKKKRNARSRNGR